jgi:dTDP-4-dehydrorhamnose reductase
MIHFSTDCVFSGKKGDYTEDDPSDAEDIYGKSKYLGEALPDNALVLRTSIIGRELVHADSLLEWFLSQNHKTVRGFKRAWWSGVTTNHLAAQVAKFIGMYPQLTGLYQVSSGKISKFDLLQLVREAYHLDIEIIPDHDFFCDRSLSGERLRAATGYVCPPWSELLRELVNDSTGYDNYK